MSNSSQESDKRKNEMRVFKDFLLKAGIQLAQAVIRAGDPHIKEPDIIVESEGVPSFGYELTEICEPEIAAAIANQQSHAIWTGDPAVSVLEKKLTKTYVQDLPVCLLIYWDGRTVAPDDVVLAKLSEELASCDVIPFEQVWYMGEATIECLFPSGD